MLRCALTSECLHLIEMVEGRNCSFEIWCLTVFAAMFCDKDQFACQGCTDVNVEASINTVGWTRFNARSLLHCQNAPNHALHRCLHWIV